ncbi:heavy-metal-associated domain-containing protein [Nocardia asteroides]
MTTTTVTVTGMTCSCCANAVNKAVGKIAGVNAVEADFASGRVTIDAMGALDRRVVAAAVNEAGYHLAD